MQVNNISFAKQEFNQPVVSNINIIFVSLINTVLFNIKYPRTIHHFHSESFLPVQ